LVRPETEPERAESELHYTNFSETWGATGFGIGGDDLDASTKEWLASYRRHSMGPGAARAMFEASSNLDATDLLGAIHVPTMAMYHTRAPEIAPDHAELISDRIAGARVVPLSAQTTSWMGPDQDDVLDLVEEFTTGQRPLRQSDDRVLATVLFTDLVSSTERAASLGDRAWAGLLDEHNTLAQRAIAHHRGALVDTAGDGLLATFDGPARAIRCALDMHGAIGRLGLQLRAGVHTGEIERSGDDVRGLAVHIGARVSALAGAGETLVSSTVKDLVAGSGIAFEDRGMHQLKGVPDEWRIFAVAD
jgi:class 3 adenylate cyclase